VYIGVSGYLAAHHYLPAIRREAGGESAGTGGFTQYLEAAGLDFVEIGAKEVGLRVVRIGNIGAVDDGLARGREARLHHAVDPGEQEFGVGAVLVHDGEALADGGATLCVGEVALGDEDDAAVEIAGVAGELGVDV